MLLDIVVEWIWCYELTSMIEGVIAVSSTRTTLFTATLIDVVLTRLPLAQLVETLYATRGMFLETRGCLLQHDVISIIKVIFNSLMMFLTFLAAIGLLKVSALAPTALHLPCIIIIGCV